MPSVFGDDSGAGFGVKGQGPTIGVLGESPTGVGVAAKSVSGKAITAEAQSGAAVSAFSDSGPVVECLTNSGTAVDARSSGGTAVSAASETGAGVVGTSKSYTGVAASSETGAGVSAFSSNGPALEALAENAAGVSARSVKGVGVKATSDESTAIEADTQQSHAISATTADENSAGVHAANTSQRAGTGVIGKVQGRNAIGVLGESTGMFDSGTGVLGRSASDTGVLGVGARRGVEGRSRGGIAVHGRMEESEDGEPYHGDGVVGETFSGSGVRGHSEEGDGVKGDSSSGPGVRAETSSGTAPALVAIQRNSTSQGAAVYAEHPSGDAGYFKGNVKVTGYIEFVGADCAEEFDVATDVEPSAVDPGTVVVIGEDNALMPSDRPCDSRVAGVIAGAGDLRPGLVLGGLRVSSERPRIRVALAGRVYCKVDARYGPITPGDLLTTSPTPGHAMRIGHHEAPVATVLGKAMRPHPHGAGLIPILVALH